MHSVWRKAFKCVNTAGNEIVFTAESSQRVNIRRACLLRNGGMLEFFIELIAKFLFVNCWIDSCAGYAALSFCLLENGRNGYSDKKA
jgi:hypothetical protein